MPQGCLHCCWRQRAAIFSTQKTCTRRRSCTPYVLLIPKCYVLEPSSTHNSARLATGAKGEGQPNWRDQGPDGLLPAPPHDPSGHTWHHPDEQLFAITKHGLAKLIAQPDYRTAMPIYEGVLSDGEIVAVLSWIKAQWPPDVQRRHDEINIQYRKSLSR